MGKRPGEKRRWRLEQHRGRVTSRPVRLAAAVQDADARSQRFGGSAPALETLPRHRDEQTILPERPLSRPKPVRPKTAARAKHKNWSMLDKSGIDRPLSIRVECCRLPADGFP